MHRIAAALLITAAVLALNAGMIRDAFAEGNWVARNAEPVRVSTQPAPGSSRLLSLLLVLETMRQSGVTLDGRKV